MPPAVECAYEARLLVRSELSTHQLSQRTLQEQVTHQLLVSLGGTDDEAHATSFQQSLVAARAAWYLPSAITDDGPTTPWRSCLPGSGVYRSCSPRSPSTTRNTG